MAKREKQYVLHVTVTVDPTKLRSEEDVEELFENLVDTSDAKNRGLLDSVGFNAVPCEPEPKRPTKRRGPVLQREADAATISGGGRGKQ